MSTAVISARGLSFELPSGRELFKDLHFTLDSRLTGLVGPNGIGKSCLAKLLAGELAPAAGVIRRAGAVTLFPQRAEPPSITVAEHLAEYEWSLLGDRLLQDIDQAALCTNLSGGQWMRVRLARALNDDFLILDEPTNDLDREGREALALFLRGRRRGGLLVSHDRDCLSLCTEMWELSNRGLMKFGGTWSDYLDSKQRERERLSAALELAKRDRDAVLVDRAEQRARQDKRNRRGRLMAARGGQPRILLGTLKARAQASTGKLAVATLEQSQLAVRSAHDALSALKIDPVMYADLVSQELPAQKLVAEARGFNIRFDDWIFEQDLEFSWRGNVRLALRGNNGSGKSSLLKALSGEIFHTRGELRLGELALLHLDQRCRALADGKSVFDNIRAVSSASDSEIRNGLARFLFAKDAVFQPVRDLSGGERMRAALARGLLASRQPELLLLDEPTNNLDLDNVEFLERIVSDFRGALIVVSHDERFLANCGVSDELTLSAQD